MNKKGFTLIELLAVIIILAVIALIATPIVLKVVENARKESNKDSTYGILDAAKLYYTESILDTTKTGIDGKTNLLDVVSITGSRPDSGTLYIANDGKTAIAVVYDNYCFKKEFNEQDLIETTTDNCSVTAFQSQSESSTVTPEPQVSNFGGSKVSAQEGDTHKGIVYLNPKDLTAECNETLANQNRNNKGALTGVKTGCMRFYIFDDTGNNYKMILDHNTSGNVAWNSTYSNASMKEVATRLSEDTNGWVGNPRLITVQEVINITGVAVDASFPSGYIWLFNNLYPSANKGGTSDYNKYPYAGTGSTDYIYGYWTSTPDTSNNYTAYEVGTGMFQSGNVTNNHNFGVRPVIELPKSSL